METEFTNVTINGPFTVGEECEVQVKACLRDDGCAWAVTSKALPFTGMYQQMHVYVIVCTIEYVYTYIYIAMA